MSIINDLSSKYDLFIDINFFTVNENKYILYVQLKKVRVQKLFIEKFLTVKYNMQGILRYNVEGCFKLRNISL